MNTSTWYNILNGMPEAVHKGYMSKSSRQRRKREVQDVWTDRDDFCRDMSNDIARGAYSIGEYRHFRLKDKKKARDISVLPFRDRCVQNDVKNAIEPLLLRQMTDDMLGGLPERGVLSSVKRYCVVRRMQRIMNDTTMTHYIQGDIRKFYDSVDNVTAIRLIERCVKSRNTLAIIRQHLFKQKKLAIGDPFSHLIANLVMSRLVRHLKRKYGKEIKAVNFADDIFIAARSKEVLGNVRKEMRQFASQRLRLHYKNIYIRRIEDAPVTFCGMKYTRGVVRLSKRTKKRYVRHRHSRRSMGSYNGILEKCDSKHLRDMVETNDNRHMGDKIRRPFAGKVKKIEQMEGIRHTIVNVVEKKSRQQLTETYMHVQAIADGLGLIVYCTSSSKIVDYLKNHQVPMRDMVIVKDWSGYYFDGTVYTDEEEEAMIRKQFGIY